MILPIKVYKLLPELFHLHPVLEVYLAPDQRFSPGSGTDANDCIHGAQNHSIGEIIYNKICKRIE